MSAQRWPDRSPFAALGDVLESVAELPAQLERIERLLHAGVLPEKRLVSFREAGQLLDVSERKIYELTSRGDLPVRTIDSRRKIAVSDIDRYIEGLGGEQQ